MSRPTNSGETPQDEARRHFLVRALSLGLLAGGGGWNRAALAELLGQRAEKLPEGKSVFDLRGEVRINGQPANHQTVIRASDKIEVGKDGHLIAAVGDSAFIVRENSKVELSGVALVIRAFRATGALLGVIAPRPPQERVKVHTVTATIGIRGTGFYVDSDPEKTYFCTCYGTTEISARADPKASEQVTTQHHEAARYILATPDKGRRIVPAPFINHTDQELMTIEALVGREVPFAAGGYERPRREDY
ncbi:MAG: hypothetical protein ACRETN_00610 [Nevskiales bacterium]